jgi:outer membrane murein-binding lipoprotein Lpp
MDVTMYVGIGAALGAVITGAVAGIVKLRNQRYSVSKDEFKVVLAEVKEDRTKLNTKVETLESKVEHLMEDNRACKEENRLMKYRLDQLEKGGS